MYEEFVSGTPFVFGWGSLTMIGRYLPPGDCFMVSGRSSARSLGILDRIREKIQGELHTFEEIEPNPLDSTVDRGAECLKDSKADYILAVGGGSAIDAAKVINVVATQGGRAYEYMNGSRNVSDPRYPLIAVPTTPGTSSEITPFAVLTVPTMMNKVGLRTSELYPDLAMIDPSLTITLPKDQTAATGLDILSHAFESYWARLANPITRRYAIQAVKLIRDHLLGAYKDGKNKEHRKGISLASVYAGLSFSNTGTTICHAISYPITTDSGLPHGMACSMSLPETYDILVEKRAEGMDELAHAFGSYRNDLSEDLRNFVKSMGAPLSMGEAGFKGGIERIRDTDLKVLQRNLCVKFDEEDVTRIIKSME